MTIRPDIRLADAPMVPVACQRCGASVLARKASWNQTSVQWSAGASEQCQERCQASQLKPDGGGLFLACNALADTIAEAARSGSLPIVDTDVPAIPHP
ncbi:hypothetical protein Mycch_1570 [Mycolicibacterium chubuense NBB4]|uniref:Ferredoxin n=1 Tax=Mycolicibacterium chubuense (strain NBB4) TaxID=710421 RepID=I4BGG2_MYCCN|nr:hypothetical protein [Mycolicibacterium chubuense]AFM16369.1 hypothetical protein Mycch_1570 [Mycolicibacterium chubuense NBB4]